MVLRSKNAIKYSSKWIYILANFFSGYFISLIGSISLTELFVLARIPHLINWGNKLRSLEFKKITLLYSLLLVTQIIAEICVGNNFINALKGVMVTVMSYFLFVFYLELLLKDITIIKWTPLTIIASLIIFGDQFGFALRGEETFFKFYLAPVVTNLVLFLILQGNKWIQKNIILITGVTSLFVIAGGARSGGFSLLFATLAYFIYIRYKTISWRKILPGVIIIVIIFQFFYAFVYIPKVVSGEWGSNQNRDQLARVDNSKNVLMMIFTARTDFFVSWQAFMDKPISGHGAWANDENSKYLKMLYSLHGDEIIAGSSTNDSLIPVHSVVVGMGTQHGIFKFIIFCVLFIYIYKLGLKTLNKKLPRSYNFYLIYLWITSFQILMFGPPAVLKSTGSLAFAVFLAFYLLKKRTNEKKIQISRRNSNL